MSTIEYGGARPIDRTRTLLVCYLLAFACLIGMRFAVRRSPGLSVALLFGLGLLLGLALSPTLI